MGQSIFNIEQDYIALCDEIEELEGEITPEIEAKLKINEEEFIQKVKSYKYLIDENNYNIGAIDGEIEVLDDRIRQLKALKETKSNLIDRLKSHIKDALLLFGKDGKSGNKTLDCGTFKMYTKKNTKLSDVKDLGAFYNKYPEYTVYDIKSHLTDDDVKKIRKALVDKEDLDIVASLNKRLILSELKAKVEIDGVMMLKTDSVIIK